MNDQEVQQKIVALLKKIAPDTEPEKLAPEENIRESLVIDSFDFLRFVAGMDEQFGISTPEEDYGKIQTMKDLLMYIGARNRK